MADDTIYRQAAIEAVRHSPIIEVQPAYMLIDKGDVLKHLIMVPSAQAKIAEKLYLYKCYITDQEGLQHEVIHVGDIRRVTGWEI